MKVFMVSSKTLSLYGCSAAASRGFQMNKLKVGQTWGDRTFQRTILQIQGDRVVYTDFLSKHQSAGSCSTGHFRSWISGQDRALVKTISESECIDALQHLEDTSTHGPMLVTRWYYLLLRTKGGLENLKLTGAADQLATKMLLAEISRELQLMNKALGVNNAG
jgi:hypothetical protein